LCDACKRCERKTARPEAAPFCCGRRLFLALLRLLCNLLGCLLSSFHNLLGCFLCRLPSFFSHFYWSLLLIRITLLMFRAPLGWTITAQISSVSRDDHSHIHT